MSKLFVAITAVVGLNLILLAALIIKISVELFSDEEFRNPLPLNQFWGHRHHEQEKTNKTIIKQIRITVSKDMQEALASRLAGEISNPRIVHQLDGTRFEYGFNFFVLNKFLDHWVNNYDWAARENLLNRFPQYKLEIFGLDIHFQYIKNSRSPEYRITRPLLLLHGFPSSFVEFQQVIPLLAEPPDLFLNFDLIIPSLPGFGFSNGASKPGMGPAEMAQLLWKMMQELELKTFYAHGSDWGSVIISSMAVMYPDSVIAIHSTMCGSLHPRSFVRLVASSFVPAVTKGWRSVEALSNLWDYTFKETGFYHLQSTKPDTLGIALRHSPTGLAAYILEKLYLWPAIEELDANVDIASIFPVDDLLDNIMIYWMTNSITSAMRTHAQCLSSDLNFHRIPVKVPTACLVPSSEPVFRAQNRKMKEDKYHNLTRYNEIPTKGHYLGFEHPVELSNDILEFATRLELLKGGKDPTLLARRSKKEL